MSILFFPEAFILHFFTLIMSGLTKIILLGSQMPFKSSSHNYAEIIDESSIFIVMYHMFCFTDWLFDAEIKHQIGYSAVGFVLFHLFGYLVILFYLSLRVKIRIFRIYMHRRKSCL